MVLVDIVLAGILNTNSIAHSRRYLSIYDVSSTASYHNNNIIIKPHIKRSLLSILTITSARAIDATLTFRPCPHEITAFHTRQYHTLRRIHGVQIFRRCISRPASTVYRQFSGTTPTKNIYDAIHHGSSTEHFYSSQILL